MRPRGTNTLMAACAALALCASEASASPGQSWGFFDRPMAAPPQQQADPRAAQPAKPRASKKDRARKFIADQVKVPEKLPAGPVQIVISIRKQQMTVYAGGHPVARSQVSTGVPGHPTPQGVFSIIEKQIYHESNIYSSAPMPYMQRITWSGVAMHQGVVPNHPASHGCIRLPAAFAKRLWSMTKVGARVIIAQDEIVPVEIANPRLTALAAANVADAAPLNKARYASAIVSDAPLKGSIDATPVTRNDEPPVETLIDQMVQAGTAESEALTESVIAELHDKGTPASGPKDLMLRPGPVSIYVSRKLGRLFVRKGHEPVFETPVTIAQGDQPLGTHVFTALEPADGVARWNVLSLPIDRTVKKGTYVDTRTKRGEKLRVSVTPPVYEPQHPGDPNAALERVTIPDSARARIAEMMSSGASLIISDLGMSHETGERGTDFIVLTR